MENRGLLGLMTAWGVATATVGGVCLGGLLNPNEERVGIRMAGQWFREDGAYFPKDTDNELWEYSWIQALHYFQKNQGIQSKFTKEELESLEREYWDEVIGNGGGIRMDLDAKRNLDEKIKDKEPWERYKTICLYWNSIRIPNGIWGSEGDETCILEMDSDEQKKSEAYQKYLKIKGEHADMNLREFYWTIWNRYEFEKNIDGAFDVWWERRKSEVDKEIS